MELVLMAIGLVLVLEGLLYAAFPNTMRRMVAEFLTMPEVTVRGACAPCSLFPKVGLPSNACANLCGARWRVTARRILTTGVSIRPRWAVPLVIFDLGVSRLHAVS